MSEIKKISRRYDILFVILLFLLSVPAEYNEIFSLSEDQTILFRHGMRTNFNGRKEMSFPYDKIVLVTIDDSFFKKYGKFPLKRTDLAVIIQNLYILGAKVICVDLIMDLRGACNGDTELAQAFRQGSTVLASRALFDNSNRFQKISYPIPVLKNSSSSGYVNLTSPSSADTFLSRLRIWPNITEWDDGWPIAVRVLSEYMGVKPVLKDRKLVIGDISVLLDQFNDIYVDFSGIPKIHRFLHESAGISCSEFLDISDLDKYEIKELKTWVENKIVILGETSTGSHDWFDTPVGMVYGAEIIADTIYTLLKGGSLGPAPFPLEILISFVFLSSIVLCTSMIPAPLPQTLTAFILFLLFVLFCTVLYVYQGMVVSMTYNLTAGVLSYFILSLSSYFRERKLNIIQQKEKYQAEKQRNIAEAASKAKSAFLASMSHELRTPLNIILGYSRLMSQSRDIGPGHRKNLGTITQSGEHLLNLINQVLDLSKIEAGKMTLDEEDFDLRGLLGEMEDMFHMPANEKGLKLGFDLAPDLPVYIRADKMRLRQILINLIGNALKFTENGGVTVRLTEQNDAPDSSSKFLRFEIEDTGPGIAREETSHLFDAFAQASAGKQSGQGTGLGLSISHKFVRLMGGDISVRSDLGTGTTFIFEIQTGPVRTPGYEKTLPIREIAAPDISRTYEKPVKDISFSDAVSALPSEIPGNLKRAVEIADIDRIYSIINEIRTYNTQLADSLACMADEFDYNQIMSLIQKISGETEK